MTSDIADRGVLDSLDVTPPTKGRWIKRFLRSRPAVIATGIILILGLACAFGPLFLGDPTVVDVTNKFAPPSSEHLLGTDNLGRDLLSRLLSGGRVSFVVAIGATLISVTLAGLVGVTAGYFGGLLDDLLSRIFEVLLAFPMLLLAIVLVAALGPSVATVLVAIGIADVPRYGRLYRALTLEAKERDYVSNAVALGYSNRRVILRHVLPNIYTGVMVVAAGNMGKVILAEASLSFLGIGVQRPLPSWGNIVSEGQPYLQYHPLMCIAAGGALTLLTISFSFVGDGLRDAFDIREGGAK